MINVIWSKSATDELLNIIDYWNKRNKSTNYTDKIKKYLALTINLIKQNNKLGVRSNIEKVRMRLILKNYYLIYEIGHNEIKILQFWDVRHPPLKTTFKKR